MIHHARGSGFGSFLVTIVEHDSGGVPSELGCNDLIDNFMNTSASSVRQAVS